MNIPPHIPGTGARDGVFDLTNANCSLRRFRNGSKHGFTLLELLVVMVIMAVLLALLMGAAGKVREQSKATQCMANLRWCGATLLHYITEQNGVYDNWMAGSSTNVHYWTWYLRYRGNYSEADILKNRCPIGPFDNAPAMRLSSHYGFYTEDPHGSRFESMPPPDTGNTAYRIRINTHPAPSSSPMLADSLSGASFNMTHTLRKGSATSRGGFYALHNGRVNVFFLDGHVEAATPKRMREVGVDMMFDEDKKIITTPLR